MKKRLITLFRALSAGIAVGLLFTALFKAGLLETVELKTLDHRFQRYAGRLTPSGDIVIITIDQNSIDYLKNRLDILWKWPRDVYGHVIRYLTMSGAKAVLLDFDFSDPDIDRAEFEEGETDVLLGEAVEEAGNVINSCLFYPSQRAGIYTEDGTDYGMLRRFAVGLEGGDALRIPENSSVVAPIPAIMHGSRGVGATNIYPDRDGIVRQSLFFQKLGADVYANSALSLVLSLSGADSVEMGEGQTMMLHGHAFPLNEKGGTYINWYGPGGPESGTYKYIPIADVLISYFKVREGLEPVVAPEAFAGKIVLLGSNAPSLYDLKPTPFSGLAPYPGVEIVATTINNLLDGSTLSREGDLRAIILIVLLSVITALTVSTVKSVPKNVVLTVMLMAASYLYAVRAFYGNVMVNLVPMEGGILLSFVAATAINYLSEGREKRWLKKAFSQYISSSVMEEVTRHPEKLKLGGEKRELSILFSDIRGFTTISEKLEPEQLTHVLNEYLTPMTDIVFRRQGTLDKYIGDAVMAIFGAPLRLENHASAACSAALDMMEELKRLRLQWKGKGMPEYIQGMDIGIGINSGPVSVGNMGSMKRFDYTVIGDNVNLSSRLEGSTKLYGVNIIVSEQTRGPAAKEGFVFRELDCIKVVGKELPVRIYELVGHTDDGRTGAAVLEGISMFEHGLGLYRKRRWEEALKVFGELHDKKPSDKASKVFMQRCENFLLTPPPEGWDGTYERRTK